MNNGSTRSTPVRFGFLMINDFTLISMSSAIEPLRMANRISGEQVYTWRTLSETGQPVTASDGISINVDCGINDPRALDNLDIMIVCGGWNVEQNSTPAVLRWLRTVSQTGISLGATCTGSFLLARAGLLDGYRCSVHWENIGALTDTFPKVHVSRSVYTIDRDRFTCSGGTSPVDMMLHFVSAQCGAVVSAGVAEQFIYDRIRQSSDRQRVPLKHVVGNQSAKLIIAVELMEANVRETISQSDIAAYTDLSRRQLQRLFQRYLTCTPSRYYLQIRLARARELLHQTSMSLVEISNLTGFVSSSHFSKSFKEHFGHSPSVERQQ
ncbi:MAG: GlxA family transcriptional regulator [Woeseia sp.]|jgi:AraC family transcriptional regulator, glycine betaine-responsive activator|nr:GlxA family transcriptional regulator [Woeseia sp.]MBT6208664.1 GlxA family transcriptional regulator [Woeseia sp.]